MKQTRPIAIYGGRKPQTRFHMDLTAVTYTPFPNLIKTFKNCPEVSQKASHPNIPKRRPRAKKGGHILGFHFV
jgi:hypothetical protein